MDSIKGFEKLQKVIKSIDDGEKLTHVDLSECGLDSIPEQLYKLDNCLEFLNLGGNKLSDLPNEFSVFQKLKTLFMPQNMFVHIPSILGLLTSLFMLSMKSNQIRTISEDSISPSIGWLILTSNEITTLPNSIGNCKQLKKLMLAGNILISLPKTLSQCTELELLRISMNDLTDIPSYILTLPKLSWLAYSSNAFNRNKVPSNYNEENIPYISYKDLDIQEQLGEGASGTVYHAYIHNRNTIQQILNPINTTVDSTSLDTVNNNNSSHLYRDNTCTTAIPTTTTTTTTPVAAATSTMMNNIPLEVAIKIYKGGLTSDGSPEDEMIINESIGRHPNSIQVLGRLADVPNSQQGLVLAYVPPSYSVLAKPPSFNTITRDVYTAETDHFSIDFIQNVLLSIASICNHIHSLGISHGDIYGHNILVNRILTDAVSRSTCTDELHSQQMLPTLLGDFGAASCYDKHDSESAVTKYIEGIEVRAYSCLLVELLDHWYDTVTNTKISTWINTNDDSLISNDSDDKSDTKNTKKYSIHIYHQLYALYQSCINPDNLSRPTFHTIYTELQAIFST